MLLCSARRRRAVEHGGGRDAAGPVRLDCHGGAQDDMAWHRGRRRLDSPRRGGRAGCTADAALGHSSTRVAAACLEALPRVGGVERAMAACGHMRDVAPLRSSSERVVSIVCVRACDARGAACSVVQASTGCGSMGRGESAVREQDTASQCRVCPLSAGGRSRFVRLRCMSLRRGSGLRSTSSECRETRTEKICVRRRAHNPCSFRTGALQPLTARCELRESPRPPHGQSVGPRTSQVLTAAQRASRLALMARV